MSNSQNTSGPLEGLLTVIGGITGAVIGHAQEEMIGLFVGALILGLIGNWVGKVADFLLQVGLLIIFLLLHSAVRQFVWGIISSI